MTDETRDPMFPPPGQEDPPPPAAQPDGAPAPATRKLVLTDMHADVLRFYADLEDKAITMTVGAVAKSLNITQSDLRQTVGGLKLGGLLTGAKKFLPTEEGRKALVEYGFAEPDKTEEEAAESPEAPAETVGQLSTQPGTTAAAPSVPVVAERRKLSEVVAERLMITSGQAWAVVKEQVISLRDGEKPATDAEVMHVLSVMQKYELDPFVKQIHAFRHKGKLHVSVGIDGWIDLAQRRGERYLGVTYEVPKEDNGNDLMIKTPGGKKCWPWVRATCHVKGRHPSVVTASLDEWYVQSTGRGPSNWDKYPTWRLQMKAFSLAVRVAFGIGLYDDADVEQMTAADYEVIDTPTMATAATGEDIKQQLAGSGPPENPVTGGLG